MILSKYRNAKVVVTPNIPMMDDEYFAMWALDENLIPIIFIDTKVSEAVRDKKISMQSLGETLEHEYSEAQLSIEMAKNLGYDEEYMKEHFSGLTPKDNKIFDIGGEAHEILANNYHGGRQHFEKQLKEEFNIVYGYE